MNNACIHLPESGMNVASLVLHPCRNLGIEKEMKHIGGRKRGKMNEKTGTFVD